VDLLEVQVRVIVVLRNTRQVRLFDHFLESGGCTVALGVWQLNESERGSSVNVFGSSL
jgi:hypothetical protein